LHAMVPLRTGMVTDHLWKPAQASATPACSVVPSTLSESDAPFHIPGVPLSILGDRKR